MSVTRVELEKAGLGEYETGEEFSNRWTGYLRSNVSQIEAVGKARRGIDVDRAVRGIIVGKISGDAVNPVHGAILHSQQRPLSSTNLLLIRSGWEGTWLATTRSVAEFGHWLPFLTRRVFDNIFRDYQSIVDEVILGRQQDPEIILEASRRLYKAIHDEPVEAPDFSNDDIGYGLRILRPDEF